MPWELGYFDGIKGVVATLPIANASSDSFKRQEYLKLYPYVDIATVNGKPGVSKLWVNESPDVYIEFDSWLQGKLPYKRA